MYNNESTEEPFLSAVLASGIRRTSSRFFTVPNELVRQLLCHTRLVAVGFPGLEEVHHVLSVPVKFRVNTAFGTRRGNGGQCYLSRRRNLRLFRLRLSVFPPAAAFPSSASVLRRFCDRSARGRVSRTMTLGQALRPLVDKVMPVRTGATYCLLALATPKFLA